MKQGDRREFGLLLWSLKQKDFLNITRHLPDIPVHMVSVIYRSPQLATIGMFQSIANSLPNSINVVQAMSQASRILRTWEDTSKLGNSLGIADTKQILTNCPSLQQLHRLHVHDSWTQQFNRCDVKVIENKVFPTPPLSGTKSIIAITSLVDLVKEGREMQHCVGSYSDKVLSGQAYVYRILEPQRATVELLIIELQLTIGEFRTYKDRQPTEQCRKSVVEWLESNTKPNKYIVDKFYE